jgi:TP901 family phage tail tape measure protein
MSSRKMFEISFAIAGKLSNSFRPAFAATDTAIKSLKLSLMELNQQYKEGAIDAEKFQKQHLKLSKQLEQTYAAQRRLTNEMKLSNKLHLSSVVDGLKGKLMAGVGALGVGYAITSSLDKAMDYESELSTIQALTGLSDQEMKKMNDLALKMGAATKYSALEAAQGIEELLKAGLTPAQVQAGALEAALNLATAGGLDLADAANIMANSLNGFKKDAMSAADAANILAGAANASSSDVKDLELGLSAVGPVADGIGVSFKEVNAVLAAFSNNALRGSDAGTSLKTFLQNVQPQTKQAAELFKQYGLITKDGTNIFFDANGELKDMADVAEILRKQFKKLNDQQRSDAFFNLFGSDAVRAATILYKEGAAGIKDMYDQMSKVTALDVAKKKMDNAAGAVEQFKGAIETLQISALMPTLPYIKKLALAAADFATNYTPMITSGIERAVEDAKNYVYTRYFNNPQFKTLDLEGKITFVAGDLTTQLGNWFETQAIPKIAEYGAKIGFTLVSDAGKAVLDAVTENPTLGILLGLVTPGPIWLKLIVAATLTGSGIVMKLIEWAEGNSPFNDVRISSEKAKQVIGAYDDFQKKAQSTPDNKPLFGGTSLRSHAKGGIFNQAHLGIVGEAGPEAWIPLERTAHSRSIWQRAGEAIGADNFGVNQIHLTYAPVIYGSGSDIRQILEDHSKDLKRELSEIAHQKRRVSFSVS